MGTKRFLLIALEKISNSTYIGTVKQSHNDTQQEALIPIECCLEHENTKTYDPKGALYYVVIVIFVFGFSIILMIASSIKKTRNKKYDNAVSKYMKDMIKVKQQERREEKYKFRMAMEQKLSLTIQDTHPYVKKRDPIIEEEDEEEEDNSKLNLTRSSTSRETDPTSTCIIKIDDSGSSYSYISPCMTETVLSPTKEKSLLFPTPPTNRIIWNDSPRLEDVTCLDPNADASESDDIISPEVSLLSKEEQNDYGLV